MPTPDQMVELSFTDLDASDSGRDESGVMHRILVRSKVPTWGFCYSTMTQAAYAYLVSILPEAGSFQFTCPDPTDPTVAMQVQAYLSNYSATWQGLPTGLYRNVKFNIIAC